MAMVTNIATGPISQGQWSQREQIHVTFDMVSTTPVIQARCFSTISYSGLQPSPIRHPVRFLIYRVKAIIPAMNEVPRDL